MSIDRGDILYSEAFPDIEHGKFFVVIGENDDELVGFFFINSRISFVNVGAKRQALQVEMTPDKYSFLHHVSYLDCASLRKIRKDLLESEVLNGTTIRKGRLKNGDIELVLEKVRASDIYSAIDKDFFI